MRLDETSLEPRPYLARGWEWKDERTLRIVLRDDVRFHSGAPFTSKDVVATLRAFASPAVQSRHARVVEAIDSSAPDGPFAVTIALKRPHATLLTDLELPILRADQAESPPSPNGQLDGLGPFTVVSALRGEIDLGPADGAALPRPAHAVTIRTVHDENARALRLHAGRADLVSNGISPTLLPALAVGQGSPIGIASRPGANLTYMLVRTDRGPLADARVRHALSLAIDRKMIATTLLGGHAEPADTLLPPGHWAYSPPSSPARFDPEAARAELSAAGQPAIHLQLLTSTDRLRASIARTIAQQMRQIGVDLEIVPLELGTMIARLNAGDFELATLQLPELTEPNVLRVFLHSTYMPPHGSNRGRVNDAQIDALLDLGDTTLEADARRRVYARLEERVRDTSLLIPLWHEDQVAVTSPRARTFTPSAEGRWLSLAGVK